MVMVKGELSHTIQDYSIWILTAIVNFWIYITYALPVLRTQLRANGFWNLNVEIIISSAIIAMNIGFFISSYKLCKELGEYFSNKKTGVKFPTHILIWFSIGTFALLAMIGLDYIFYTYYIKYARVRFIWDEIVRIGFMTLCLGIWVLINSMVENSFLSRIPEKYHLRK